MSKNEYFPTVKKIEYKGPDSRDPLSFAYYDENQVVAGKTMKDHFRFAIAYWHSFCNENTDPFGKVQEVFRGIKRPTRLKMRSTGWKQGSSFLQNWVHPIGVSTTVTLHQKEKR